MPSVEIKCPRARAEYPWKHYYHHNREAAAAMCSEALRMMAEDGKKLSENRPNPLFFLGFRGFECRSRIVSKAAADAWLAGEVAERQAERAARGERSEPGRKRTLKATRPSL